MSIECPHCEHTNRVGARFCDHCGRQLTASATLAADEHVVELRHGTFMFCDLVQSTELANRLDFEDLQSVFGTFRKRVSEVCDRYGGYVIRFVGDGAFISFAYPLAREDGAESAVRAALDLIVAIQAPSIVPSVALNLRVGMASGTVVVGALTHEAAVKEQVVDGSVLHLAARLASIAIPAAAVISDATRRLAGGFFEYRDLGKIQLKGFAAGERAWQVIGPTSVASRYEARREIGSDGELVGRQEQVASVSEQWSAALSGHGRALLIVGEPGIGKSKLARVLRALALRDNAQILELDCTPRTSNTPLYSAGVLLRRLAGIGTQDSDNERRRRARNLLTPLLEESRLDGAMSCLAPLFGLPSVPDAAAGQTADTLREQAIRQLIEIVRTMAQRRALLVLCEDLHWADATTLEVLRRLRDEISELPVLLAATSRESSESLTVLSKDSLMIPLEPLGDEDARTLVHLITHGDELSPAVVDEIIRFGGGVPLYIEELTRSALESAAVGQGSSQPPTPAIPQTLQAIIQARVDRLGSLKLVVQTAAIIGREFQLRQLDELLPIRPADLHQALARLIDQGLLAASADARAGYLRFRHALIHDAVYNTTLRSERQRLHLKHARALVSSVDGGLEAAPDVVAHHLAAAQQFDEAVRYLLQAATGTAARAAYAESAGHCHSGIALLDNVDAKSRQTLELRLRTQLALALAATAGYAAPEVREAYDAAHKLWRVDADAPVDGDPQVRFPIVRGLASFFQVRCELLTTDELCSQGVRLAEQAGRDDFLIDVLAVQGYNSIYRGQLAVGRDALERCIAMYEQSDGRKFSYFSPQDPANAAWSELAIVAWLQGDVAVAEGSITRALTHADELGRPFDQAYAKCHAAALRNLQRRFPEAVQHASSCVDISEKHGFKVWWACGLLQKGVAASSLSDTPEPTAVLDATLKAFRAGGGELNTSYFLWGLARGQARIGEFARARATVSEALQQAESTGETWCTAELLLLAADLEENAETARAYRGRALSVAEAAGARTVALRALLALEPGPSTIRDALDGKTPYPSEGDWVLAALRKLREPTAGSPA